MLFICFISFYMCWKTITATWGTAHPLCFWRFSNFNQSPGGGTLLYENLISNFIVRLV